MPTRKSLPDWASSLVELAMMQVQSIEDNTQKAVLDPNDRLRVLSAYADAHALKSTLNQLRDHHATVPKREKPRA